MSFTSFNFILYFPILITCYWVVPKKYQRSLLLISSYLFYFNIKPIFSLLLMYVTSCTYIFALLMENTLEESKKSKYLIVSIFLILLPLVFYKYFGPINDVMITTLDVFGARWALPEIKLILPVGISFYTFVSIGYIVDVYNGEISAEKNIGTVGLFISFFPLIMSGPIERSKTLLPQLQQESTFNYTLIKKGTRLLLWGYFMKLVVADRLGLYIDSVYGHIPEHNGTSLLLASFLYPFQVYADLGGYSLIAIGTSKMLGIDVIQNFKRPFFATSMAEFWRRWHISLISWLTDYVYTPLAYAFRRYRIWGIVLALLITFLISGIWHGAALTFIVWGVLQGIFLSVEALTQKKRSNYERRYNLNGSRWYPILGVCVTFLLFSSSQIFGRADSVNDALLVYTKIFSAPGKLFVGSPSVLIYGLFWLMILLSKDYLDEYMPNKFKIFDNDNKYVQLLAYNSLIFIILLFGVFDGGQFIYFQF